MPAQVLGEGFEMLSLVHQASPEYVHIAEYAGRRGVADTDHLVRLALAAVGVPSTSKVPASPTALRLRQNCAEMPR